MCLRTRDVWVAAERILGLSPGDAVTFLVGASAVCAEPTQRDVVATALPVGDATAVLDPHAGADEPAAKRARGGVVSATCV
eukprot:gene23072-44318_t